MAAVPAAADSGVERRVEALVQALRRAAVPVAVSDGIDARRSAAAVDLLDRTQLREALAAALVKAPGHRAAFDVLFDAFFPPAPGPDPGGALVCERDTRDLVADLVAALHAGDDAALAALAREAVATLGRVDNRDGTQGFYAYRVHRELNPQGLLRRLLTEAAIDPDTFEGRLLRGELERRLHRFREAVDAETRRRLAAQRGPEHVARTLVRPLPEDLDFFRVTPAEEAAMRRAARVLARRLATKLAARRKRGRRGRLDARRTLRRALGTGGVPADPAFRTRRPHRPEVVLLCDVSGSVAAFAKFTMLFCHALQGQFTRVRSFAFIDTVDEVTDLVDGADPAGLARRLAAEAQVVWLDGHSDYGNAFGRIVAEHADALTPRTTVLVLGDARNNYRQANEPALAEIRRRAKRVYWLNPEPSGHWDSGDSIASRYAAHVHRMVECRNLRQLAAFVERLA